MKLYTNPSFIEQFACYAQKATSQGAFFQVETLINRFHKRKSNRQICDRQKDRYRAGIQKIAFAFGLKCSLIPGQRGYTLCISSLENSYFNPYYEKITALAQPLLEKLYKSKESSIKVYEVLRRMVKNASNATLGRIVNKLKDKSKTLGLDFFKVGRDLHVRLRYSKTPNIRNKNNYNQYENKYKKITKNAAQNTDIFYFKKTKDEELLRNTASAAIRFSKSMDKKAFWLARELGNSSNFYDNCKVKRSMGMLVNFARWAIKEGFEDALIQGRFNRALLQRHRDATDKGLNLGQPGLKFEMSSTVSLAKSFLLDDRKTRSERWNHLKTVVLPQREAQEPKPKPQKRPKLSTECQIKEPELSEEEKIQIFFLKAGFNEHKIKIFMHYQNKRMSLKDFPYYKGLIEKMLSLFNCRNSIRM